MKVTNLERFSLKSSIAKLERFQHCMANAGSIAAENAHLDHVVESGHFVSRSVRTRLQSCELLFDYHASK